MESDLDMADYPNNTLNVHAWFVEQVAEYSDGGNGAGEYHDVVRKIVDLGTPKWYRDYRNSKRIRWR